MRIFMILTAFLLSGCSSLIANFEDDTVGSRPAAEPSGRPDDRISFSRSFQGEVRGLPLIDPTRSRDGRQSLEVSGNSSITFASEPIPEGQQASRHTVSFLFRDGTTRGKTIRVSRGTSTAASFRLSGDTITISGPNGQDEEQFSIRTIGIDARGTVIIDPRSGRIRAFWRTANETLNWSTQFAEPGEGRSSDFSLRFSIDSGGQFPRGRITIDNVRAIWSPRFSFGSG